MGHTTQEDLFKQVEKARKKVSVGAHYFHYKNPKDHYVVEFIGLLETTEEPCIAYRALYGKGLLWVRALKDFTDKVEAGKKKVSRFSKV